MKTIGVSLAAVFFWCSAASWVLAEPLYRSHAPLRTAPVPANRPLSAGPTYFVDATKGDDRNDGARASPWKSVSHAVTQLKVGDTLVLRGGIYYENIAARLVGTADAPITIRSHPNEQAILDGGLREFFESPAEVWEPFAAGAPGEFRSRRRYPNLRNVVSCFGDSMIGLQSYYHVSDLRSESGFVEPNADKSDIRPLYCGPGLWYDSATGYVHARLAHTHLPGFDNYAGETDPRRLPLVVAPFRSTPLHVDGAAHIRFQDLIIRGGGYETVVIDQARDIEFDNVTVWCGTYGMKVTGTHRLKLFRSALYGNIAPWSSRFEAGLNSYPGRTQRDITRLNTHALLATDGNREFSVYAYPFNDDWDISYCEFTDASDGLYLGGVSLRFHHNLVYNMHDDGIYLSPMYPRHLYLRGGARLELFQNYFGRCLTMLAFGGTESTQDTIYLYRNIIDLRAPVHTARPKSKDEPAPLFAGQVMSDHGSPPWPAMFAYHNTVVARTPSRSSDMMLIGAATPERPRRLFNNIFLHGGRLPVLRVPEPDRAHSDGNLYWQPALESQRAAGYFQAFQKSPAFENSKQVYPPGFETNSRVADPIFMRAEFDADANDYRLQPGSPAIDAGVKLPAEWPAARLTDPGPPDIGALPLNASPLQVGRSAALRQP